MFEKSLLRRICEYKVDEMRGLWKKLNSGDIQNYRPCSQDIRIRSKNKWSGNVTYGYRRVEKGVQNLV
jgi:hypothetical protein